MRFVGLSKFAVLPERIFSYFKVMLDLRNSTQCNEVDEMTKAGRMPDPRGCTKVKPTSVEGSTQ